MTLHTLPTGYQPGSYDEHAEMISAARGEVLAELAAGLQAIERAGAGIAELRSNAVHDVELVEGRDGRDLATFIDDSIRLGRRHARHHRQGDPVMSAAAQRRAALELVPKPDAAPADTEWLTGDEASAATDPAAEEPESWQAQTVLNEWEPEHQLIGALMWLTAEQARPILELVPNTAIWQPMRQWAFEIIRSLVAEDRDPNPVVVLAAARQRSWSLGQHADQPPTPYRHHRLAVYLATTYTQALSPAAAAGDYAREVLDEAYRRAFRDNGIRMQQLGRCGAERELITDQFAAIRDELADLWRRAEAAAKPGWWRP